MSPAADSSPIDRLRAWLRSDLRTLRWVLLALYTLLLLGLVAISSFGGDPTATLICITVLIVAQLIFILGAGTIQLCRPIRKRRLWMPVLVSSIMFAALVAGMILAFWEFFKLDQHTSGDFMTFAFWGLLGASWIGWGVLIFIYARNWQRYRVLVRLSNALFAGSLLELIATVPAHLFVIRRPGCLVGIGTMLGIIAGVNVMLFSFGPMIAVLFLRPRYRAERAAGNVFCEHCGYDLRASVGRCPECGQPFTAPAGRHALNPS